LISKEEPNFPFAEREIISLFVFAFACFPLLFELDLHVEYVLIGFARHDESAGNFVSFPAEGFSGFEGHFDADKSENLFDLAKKLMHSTPLYCMTVLSPDFF
jgi:hypothetical protein